MLSGIYGSEGGTELLDVLMKYLCASSACSVLFTLDHRLRISYLGTRECHITLSLQPPRLEHYHHSLQGFRKYIQGAGERVVVKR